MEVKGIIKFIGVLELVGDKEFKKRELILEVADNPQYPQMVKFEASQAKCEQLDKLNVGDEINLHFNLNGREWLNKEGKTVYFNTLSLWKYDLLKAGSIPAKAETVDVNSELENPDDLPF